MRKAKILKFLKLVSFGMPWELYIKAMNGWQLRTWWMVFWTPHAYLRKLIFLSFLENSIGLPIVLLSSVLRERKALSGLGLFQTDWKVFFFFSLCEKKVFCKSLLLIFLVLFSVCVTVCCICFFFSLTNICPLTNFFGSPIYSFCAIHEYKFIISGIWVFSVSRL